jgi:stage III sporulation protein AE
MAGNFGGGDKAGGVANLMRQVAFIGMGLVMTSFVGVVVGQRAASGVADGVALRTAKYVSSTFIPVAGKMIGDTMDMFFFASFGLKSALGIAGCVAVFAAVFSPLLRIVSCLLAWKIALAVLGPLCGVQVQKTLKTMADGLAFVAVSVLVTSFVFVICLSLVAQATRPY